MNLSPGRDISWTLQQARCAGGLLWKGWGGGAGELLTGNCLLPKRLVLAIVSSARDHCAQRGDTDTPTLLDASVKLLASQLDRASLAGNGWMPGAHLFSIVDFPDEGLPTRPMSGSRGIVGYILVCFAGGGELYVIGHEVEGCCYAVMVRTR